MDAECKQHISSDQWYVLFTLLSQNLIVLLIGHKRHIAVCNHEQNYYQKEDDTKFPSK
jgi:hypothetical protein